MKWVVHPYTGCAHGCVYCYATNYIPRHSFVRVKKGAIESARRDVRALPKGSLIELSSSSDPYTPPESSLGVTRAILQILLENGMRVLITTKSSLVIRDLDILSKYRDRVAVAITITTADDSLAKMIEPGAPPPSERLKAIKILSANNIATIVRLDPIIPFINDDEQQIERVIKAAAAAGAQQITTSTYKAKPIDFRRVLSIVKNIRGEKIAEELKYLYYGDNNTEVVQGYRYLRKQLRFEYIKTVMEYTQREGLVFATCREGFSYLHTPGFACDGSTFAYRDVMQLP